MLEAFIATMPIWQKLTAYAFLLIGLFIFVKTSKLKILGRPIIPLRFRIALALFFPILFTLGIIFGAVIFGILITVLLVAFTLSIFTGKKPKLPKFPKFKINIIRKNL